MSTDDLEFTDVAENPVVYNAAIQAAITDPEPEIPSIDPPRDVFFRLPGGVVVDGRTFYEVEARELTGADEEKIARARESTDPTRLISTISECGTEKIGPYRISDVVDDMLVGDREYLLIAIRDATYGSEIDLGQVDCPGCHATVDVTVDTHDIPVRRLGSASEREFEVRLRKGGKALVRLPTVADQRAYMENPDQTAAERNSILLSRCVIVVTQANGEELSVAAFPSLVRETLGIADRNRILEEIAKRAPGPQYDEVEVEHECGAKIYAPIGLVSLFPGL